MFYLVGTFRTSSPGNLKRLKWLREPLWGGGRGVRLHRSWHKGQVVWTSTVFLWIRESQISQGAELALFWVRGDAGVWTPWRRPFAGTPVLWAGSRLLRAHDQSTCSLAVQTGSTALLLGALRAPEFTQGGPDPRRLWRPCLLLWQKMLHCSTVSIDFIKVPERAVGRCRLHMVCSTAYSVETDVPVMTLRLCLCRALLSRALGPQDSEPSPGVGLISSPRCSSEPLPLQKPVWLFPACRSKFPRSHCCGRSDVQLCPTLLWSHWLYPIKPFCPRDFLGKNTEWVTVYSSRGSGNQTCDSCIGKQFFITAPLA